MCHHTDQLPQSLPKDEQSLSFFAGLDTATAEFVRQHLQEEVFPAEHIVFEENAVGNDLYIVQSGRVQVVRRLETGVEHVLSDLGPGEIFGEMAVIENRPRSARIVTAMPTRLLVMSHQTFDMLVERHPAVIVHLFRIISARLRERGDQLEELLAEKLQLVEELGTKNAKLEYTLEQLQKAMETVVEHERVTRDLEIARQIQQQMLPAAFPQVSGLELAATMVPSQRVGGDFYDAVCLGPSRICLLLGDVSGKGIPAAMQMARFMGEFRACVSQRNDPVSVVQSLNESVCARNMTWTSFITLQYVVLDLAAGQMQFICAGHPPLFLCHADGQVVKIGQMANIPLGIDATFAYQHEEHTLRSGDRLLLYSDGSYEAQNIQGDRLGLPRLAAWFAAASPHPQHAIHALQDAITAFTDTQSLRDDTTFVCARIA